MTDPYFINGVALDNVARQVETAEGVQEAPAWRETGIVVPTAHGELDAGSDPTAMRRAFGPGRITFSGWILGVDPVTGAWAGDDLGPYFARVSELMRLFYARNLEIDHVRPDGTRRAHGHLVGALAPSREPASPWFGRWKATVTIPGAFWTALAPVTASGTVASGGTINLSAFAAGEAPIADGLLTFGPANNPTFIQGGSFCQYAAVISAGRQLTVDCSDWSLGTGSGSAWTPDPSKLVYGPGPAFFELDPTGPPLAVLTHTGGGTAFASFTGVPKYLTS